MAKKPEVRLARIYDDVVPDGGSRVLVDRLWPRGMSKERAHLDDWCKQVAPSPELRKWYGHDSDKYDEFARRYRAELKDGEHAEAFEQLQAMAAHGPLTLLTASKRSDISEAAVLVELLNG